MAMGRRRQQRQTDLWVATDALPASPGHPFYERLNQLLAAAGFDAFCEAICQPFYAPKMGRSTPRRWAARACRRGCTSAC